MAAHLTWLGVVASRKNVSVGCLSLSAWAYPFFWFAILRLTGKLFTPQLFSVSKSWHWMLTTIGVFVSRLAPSRTVWWITMCVCGRVSWFETIWCLKRVLHSRHDEQCSMTIPLQILWYKWLNMALESEFCPIMDSASCALSQAAFPSSFPCPRVLSTTLRQCILSICCRTWSWRGSAWLTGPKSFQTEAAGIDYSCVRLGPKTVIRCPDLSSIHPSCLEAEAYTLCGAWLWDRLCPGLWVDSYWSSALFHRV